MKVSRYNIEIQRDGSNYIFNSLTGAFARINDEYYKVYQAFKQCDNDKIHKASGKIVNDFREAGFLIDDNLDELGYLKLLQKRTYFSSEKLWLTIIPTQQCNFRCFYCYQKHLDKYMTQEIKDLLINYISKNITKYKSLHITWYGGEPLLMLNDILELSQQIINKCEENNIIYTSNMVTNGYLLTEEVAKKLKEIAKINRIQITLDGDKESHDRHRFLENGEGTFDVIFENIKNACEYLNIVIRSNLTKENYKSAYGLIDRLKNNNLFERVKLYFHPVRAFKETECENVDCLAIKNFAQIEIELLKYLIDKGVNLNVLVPKLKYVPCLSPAINSFVVGSDGYLYKCWNRIESKFAIGDLWSGPYYKDEKFLKWVNWEYPSRCINCNILPICQSGCPNETFYPDFECLQFKYNLIDRLGLLLENHMKYKIYKKGTIV